MYGSKKLKKPLLGLGCSIMVPYFSSQLKGYRFETYFMEKWKEAGDGWLNNTHSLPDCPRWGWCRWGKGCRRPWPWPCSGSSWFGPSLSNWGDILLASECPSQQTIKLSRILEGIDDIVLNRNVSGSNPVLLVACAKTSLRQTVANLINALRL